MKDHTYHFIQGTKVFIQRNNSEQDWWRKADSEVPQYTHQPEYISYKKWYNREQSYYLLKKFHSLESKVTLEGYPWKKLHE